MDIALKIVRLVLVKWPAHSCGEKKNDIDSIKFTKTPIILEIGNIQYDCLFVFTDYNRCGTS